MPAPATAADIMRSPLTTVEQEGHVAAAAYLMKHAGATALMVLEAWTDLPVGIITEKDIAHAAADGKDANRTRIRELMTTRPTVIKTTTSVYDTARVMTSGHFRHLPVVGDAGLVGIVDIIDVCRALLEPAFPSCPPARASESSARPSLSRAGDDRLQGAHPWKFFLVGCRFLARIAGLAWVRVPRPPSPGPGCQTIRTAGRGRRIPQVEHGAPRRSCRSSGPPDPKAVPRAGVGPVLRRASPGADGTPMVAALTR
jgi:CBS domain-containing protein